MKNMKKILSVVLALFLLTATFSVAASAEAANETPVGSADVGLAEGEFAGDKSSGGHTISVKVNEVQHRYAVDLTFNFDDLTIDSTITWNVEEMKYDVSDTKLENTTRSISVTNRSDMPVYAKAIVVDSDAADGVTITASAADKPLEVGKATVGEGNTAGASTSADISVTLASENWQNVAGYYAAKRIDNNNDTFTLTTVTVVISKSATPAN